ncbi:MAG: hypothetical protein E7211_10220 [Clostridium lundense]|nr:hypothetical protein [Clostridium lundense]
MKSYYKRLGDYIQPCNEFNDNMEVKELLGINNNKYFQQSQTNTIGIDLQTYRIVRNNQFAYNRATTRNGDKISIALREGKDCIVSPSYRIFESKDENVLNSEYLMMWFRRSEFDRYARFKSHGSAHEFFEYDEMCEVSLPIPSIERQKEVVKEYKSIVDRINLNNKIIDKLEAAARAIYRQWFVDFEFPDDNGKPYKTNGGELELNKELGKEIPKGWKGGKLKDIAKFSVEKISIQKLTTKNYISTENMLQDRGGIVEIEGLPAANNVNKFNVGEILISNIRPYFKKIWLATFDGGCSNDVLCLKTTEGISSEYLYYILERDAFFDYVMAGSNGAKMPRGDKDWIMDYPILIPSENILSIFNKFLFPLNLLKNSKRQENTLLKNLSTVLLSKLATVEDNL